MKSKIKKLLNESLVFEVIESLIDEDYPSSFDMAKFKQLTSFNARIKYCEEHLSRISSGSGRVVYKIDDEKVIKLAKNKKGLAQNETEIDHSQETHLSDILAHIFDYDENNLWSEMELARRVKISDFERITGFKFKDYSKVLHNYGERNKSKPHTIYIDPKITEAMWEDEFTYEILSYIGNSDVPVGDLMRLNSYGIVKRGGQDEIVLIDYGLTNETYTSYYS